MGQPLLGQLSGMAYPGTWLLGLAPSQEGKWSVTTVHRDLVLRCLGVDGFVARFCREYGVAVDWEQGGVAAAGKFVSVSGGVAEATGV